jgi:hypothetical protein
MVYFPMNPYAFLSQTVSNVICTNSLLDGGVDWLLAARQTESPAMAISHGARFAASDE